MAGFLRAGFFCLLAATTSGLFFYCLEGGVETLIRVVEISVLGVFSCR